jgi:hypothetical protein
MLKYAKAAGVSVDGLIDDDVKLSLGVASRKKEKKNRFKLINAYQSRSY